VLLIVTNESDLASDFLVLRLQERQVPYFRLNTERLGDTVNAQIVVDGARSHFELSNVEGRRFCSWQFSGAYMRDPRPPDFESQVVPEQVVWADSETREFIRSLWRMIPSDVWFNDPQAVYRASNKVEQLIRADALGFLTPRTLVTSDSRQLRPFLHDLGGIAIAKAVRAGFMLSPGRLCFAPTQLIRSQDMPELETAAPIPTIYQELIIKRSDVRVTVVGHQVFAAQLLSQQHPETSVDWRTWDFLNLDLQHQSIELPASIANQCVALNHEFGLRYSAIDLVWNDEGEFVFLELNPVGQWAWIEQMLGLPIRDAIIDLLLLGR
jgi:hypothetical protein